MSSTRGKLIEILEQNKHQYISGQVLSDELQISRNAIWKHMNELKKDGYEIEAKRNKGYKIVKSPNKLSKNTIKWGLRTNWLGSSIVHKETVDSTQSIAHDLARSGAKEGTVVIANEQVAGRGRMNRYWHSTKGKGIWMSMILRPNILPNQAPQLTLLTAVVLADVITSFSQFQGITLNIKWPNDLLINNRKVAGILTEMQAEQDQIQYIIIGIGMNVNHHKDEIPKDLEHKATSLFSETDEEWPLTELIQEILATFERKYEYYLNQGFADIKAEWKSYGFRLGKEVKITTLKETWKAPFLGIADDGAMVTKDKNGHRINLYSGEINWFYDS